LDPRNDQRIWSSDARSSSATDTTYRTSYTLDSNGRITDVAHPVPANNTTAPHESYAYSPGATCLPRERSRRRGQRPAGRAQRYVPSRQRRPRPGSRMNTAIIAEPRSACSPRSSSPWSATSNSTGSNGTGQRTRRSPPDVPRPAGAPRGGMPKTTTRMLADVFVAALAAAGVAAAIRLPLIGSIGAGDPRAERDFDALARRRIRATSSSSRGTRTASAGRGIRTGQVLRRAPRPVRASPVIYAAWGANQPLRGGLSFDQLGEAGSLDKVYPVGKVEP
jgi:hypothetical protein